MDAMGGYNSVVGHLLQQTLRCLCTDSDWVYAVFWRILPRNYPPPKWECESNMFDRSKGNKRNWILVWEDGFCDFVGCARAAVMYSSSSDTDLDDASPSDNNYTHCCRSANNFMQPELFFKMSHEVYNFGEGLMGKVAADSSHKWVYKDPADADRNYSSSWQGALDPHPRTWEGQFRSGIETIAIVAVKEGLVQLGSLKKAAEDLNFVLSLQRKFNYLHSIPGVYAMHPSSPPPLSHFSPSYNVNKQLSYGLPHQINVKRVSTTVPSCEATAGGAAAGGGGGYNSIADILSAAASRHRRVIAGSSGAAHVIPRFAAVDVCDRDDEFVDEDEEEEDLVHQNKYNCGVDAVTVEHPRAPFVEYIREDFRSANSAYSYNSAALHALLSRLPSVGSTKTYGSSCSPEGGADSNSSTTTFDLTNQATVTSTNDGLLKSHMRPYFAHLRTCE